MHRLQSLNFSNIREHLLNNTLLFLAVISIPNLIDWFSFVTSSDWRNIDVQSALSLTCFPVWLARKKISYTIKTGILLSLIWLSCLIGLVYLGPTTLVGLLDMLFVIAALAFLNKRTALMLIIGNMLCSSLIAIAASQQWSALPINFIDHPYPASFWLKLFWQFISVSLFVAYLSCRLQREINADNGFAEQQRKIMAEMPGFFYQFVLHSNGATSMPYASEALINYFGVPPEAVKTNAAILFSKIHPEDLSTVWNSIEVSKQTMNAAHAVFRIIHPEKHIIWVEYSSKPERLANNDIRWHGLINDITQRKRAEQQLTATLENTPNVAVQWYDEDTRVLYWNNASEQILGWRRTEAVGKTVDELMNTPEEKQRLQEIFKSIRVNDAVISKETSQCRHENQQLITLSSSIFAISNTENPIYVCMAVEITDQQLAKQALQEAKLEAELANQAKSEFLASMSHELRTPLNAIIGFAQLLEMGQLSPLTADQKSAVSHIFNSGHHLLSLINEILDLVRIENGKINLKLENIKIENIIEEVISLSSGMALERQIAISYEHSNNYSIYADTARVRQILLNLVSNAIKYNRQGGEIIISSVIADNMVRIIVADTGMGISEHYRPEVFKPFKRLSAEKSTIEGTGIGLVISKQLVEAMNGSIDYESSLGKGSRFWINLPRSTSRQSTFYEPPMAQQNLKKKLACSQNDCLVHGRVLYIEDSLLNINVMKQVFRTQKNLELVIAETAEAGLKIIRTSRVNLVLMDSNLPGLSGLEALAIIKNNPQSALIPVIAVSAAAMPNIIAAGLNAGFSAYLTKPFDVEELLEVIHSHLQCSQIEH